MTDDNRPRRPSKPTGARPPTRRPSPRGAAAEPREDQRIAKVMARAGLCSRRDAETWVAAGRVALNGRPVDSPAVTVRPGDRVTVDGRPLPDREPSRLFLFHKPRGVVTTARDPEARQTVFDVLPAGLPRVVTVGRLDINTEGLMLLTNDGGLARVLELPSTGWIRRYRARANGEIAQEQLDALAGGLTVDGVDYAGIEATLDRRQGANVWLTLGLREGKNREIKRVLEHLGLSVTRLIRTSYGPFGLGELPVGTVTEVKPRVLRDQLGEALMRAAGVELPERPASGGVRGRPPSGAEGSDRHAPTPRAHVSALRAAREKAAEREGRRRTERGATADRRGRPVAVERISSAAKRDAPPARHEARRAARFEEGEAERPRSPRRPRETSFDAAPRRWERGAGGDMDRKERRPDRQNRQTRDWDRLETADARPMRRPASSGAAPSGVSPGRPERGDRSGAASRPGGTPRGQGGKRSFGDDRPRSGGQRPAGGDRRPSGGSNRPTGGKRPPGGAGGGRGRPPR